MRLAITLENCTPSAKIRKLGYRERATGDEMVWSGGLRTLAKRGEDYANLPAEARVAYSRKVGRNVMEYLGVK